MQEERALVARAGSGDNRREIASSLVPGENTRQQKCFRGPNMGYFTFVPVKLFLANQT